MKFINRILIVLNVITILYILYNCVIEKGPFVMEHGEPGEGLYIHFKVFFLIAVLIAIIIPVILFLHLKKKFWLFQALVIIACTVFWKSNLIQSTLLINAPTSDYRNYIETNKFIAQHKNNVSDVLKYIEKNIGTDTLEVNKEYDRMFITGNAIWRGRHLKYLKTDIFVNVDGKEALTSQYTEIFDTLCIFHFPDSISKKMKGFVIEYLHTSNNRIAFCGLKSKNNNASKTFEPATITYFPHGKKETMKQLNFPHSFEKCQKGYFKEGSCDGNQFCIDNNWSFYRSIMGCRG